MKRIVLLALSMTFCIAALAQVPSGSDPSQYQDQYNKLYKAYVKSPDDVEVNMLLADYYSDTLNPMLNYALAMNHISTAESQYISIVQDRSRYKDFKRLIKKKITPEMVHEKKVQIVKATRRMLSHDKPVSDDMLDNLSAAFKEDPYTMRLIEGKRLHSRYVAVQQTNTLKGYMDFINSYPSTLESEYAEAAMGDLAAERISGARRESEVDSLLEGYLTVPSVQAAATKKKSSLAFARVEANPSVEAYRSFMKKYPGSDEYLVALQRLDDIMTESYSKMTTARQLADFAKEYSDNPLADDALEKIRRMILDEHDMQAAEIYLAEFPLDISYNDIYLEYYRWHTEEGNAAPLKQFAQKHGDFPYRMALQEALESAEQFDQINIMSRFDEKEFSAWTRKIQKMTGKKASYVALVRTLQPFIDKKEWTKALERIESFSICFEDYCVDEVNELRAILEAPANSKTVLSGVVTPAYDMTHPVMHPSNTLYYNKEVGGVSTIQMARLSKDKGGSVWRGIGAVRFNNMDNKRLQIYSFYNGGKNMLLGKDGDIMIATYLDSVWSVTETLPAPVNSEFMDYDAYMLPDGSGILLASDRPGGQNMQASHALFHGDTALASDIYFVPLTDKGWGDAVNLGMNVNSPYMECSPLVSDDLKTIYFVTDGRGGLGYGDIYYATRDNVNDWRHWSKPVNYGKETNSSHNEKSISFNKNGQSILVCSNVRGRYGCYSVPSRHVGNAEFTTVTVYSDSVGMTIDIYDAANTVKLHNNQELERGGKWQSSFYSSKQYILLCQCNGLFIPGIVFTPSAKPSIHPAAYDESSLLNLAKQGSVIPLSTLSQGIADALANPMALSEMDHLATFLKQHPSLVVELVIHTAGNNDRQCFTESQQQGQTIKKYLISKGIQSDNIIVSAYGNSMTKQGKATPSVGLLFHEN